MQLDDAVYMSDKKDSSKRYRKFHNELSSCLDSLEKVQANDFASLNNGLQKIQRILQSHKNCDEVPCKLQLCRMFGKCMDPTSEFMGVHRTAIETMSRIFLRIGPERLARDLPLYTTSVFALFPAAQIQTRPDILQLMETHIITLPSAPLIQCFGGLAAAVLPAISQSNAGEQYNRVVRLLDTVHKRLRQAEENALKDGRKAPPPGHPMTNPIGGEKAFFHVLWSIVHHSGKLRGNALRYLRTKLPTAEPVPDPNNDEQEDGMITPPNSPDFGSNDPGVTSLANDSMVSASGRHEPSESAKLAAIAFGPGGTFVMPSKIEEFQLGGDPARVHIGLMAALQDTKDEQTLRLVLDVLFHHFPLHEENIFTPQQKVQLVAQAILLLPSPQHAVLTRVFFWFYAGRAINPEYFNRVSKQYIKDAFLMLFEQATKDTGVPHIPGQPTPQQPATGQFPNNNPPQSHKVQHNHSRCFDALFQLLRRPDPAEGEQFQQLVPPLIPSITKTLAFCNEKRLLNANRATSLFEAIDWTYFLKYGHELLDVLHQEIVHSKMAVNAVAVLESVRSLIETTTAQYLGLETAVTRSMPELLRLLKHNCEILRSLCELRRTRSMDSTSFVNAMRIGISTFNTTYFVIRGYMSSVSQVSTEEAVEAAASLVVAIVDVHVTTAENADQIFLSEATQPIAKEDAALFAEACDALSTVLSHSRRDDDDAAVQAALERGEDLPRAGSVGMTASDSDIDVPDWLRRLQRVIAECPPSLALVAAQLFFDATLGPASVQGMVPKPLLKTALVEKLYREDAFRPVLNRLWKLLVATEAQHHMNIAKLIVRVYERPNYAPLMDAVMRTADVSNCRRFATLFRVIHETGGTRIYAGEPPMLAVGLMMMLSTLGSRDNNLTLISHAFLAHSVGYLQRVVEPMFDLLLPCNAELLRSIQQHAAVASGTTAKDSSNRNSSAPSARSVGDGMSEFGYSFTGQPYKDRLLVCMTLMNIQRVIPDDFLKQLLRLPAMANQDKLAQAFERLR